MIGLLLEEQTRCFLDTGSGNNRKGLWLSDVDMSQDLKQALIRFHSSQKMTIHQVSSEKVWWHVGKW